MAGLKTYTLNVLIGFDQLITTLIGGDPDETLSSYAWRMEVQDKPWGRITRPGIDWLMSWYEPNHCRRAYRAERMRTQFPPELRGSDATEETVCDSKNI